MSATYTKDPSGAVHAIDPTADGEFTFCSRDHGMEDEGGFEGEFVDGPATCQDCKEAFDKMREGMKGARWKIAQP